MKFSLVDVDTSIHHSSRKQNLSFKTLSSYVKKSRDDTLCRITPNYKANQIFSLEWKQAVIEYIITDSKIFQCSTTSDCCKLVNDSAKANIRQFLENRRAQKNLD